MADEQELLPEEVTAVAPGENAEFYRTYLSSSPLFSGLILRNLGLYPFVGEWTSSSLIGMAQILYSARSTVMGIRTDRRKILVLLMGEILGPYLNNALFKDAVESRGEVVRIMSYLIHHNELIDTLSIDRNPITYGAAVANEDEPPFDREFRRLFGVPLVADWPQEGEIPSCEAALRILYFCYYGRQPSIDINGLDLITNVTVSISKRGTISDEFLDKIREGVRMDLQKNVRVDREVISMFYTKFGTNIDETTIQEVKALWEQIIPVEALRLRLTVHQLVGSGLTAFMVVGKAIRLYPTFNWRLVAHLYPAEFQRYVYAVLEVNGNLYYGFKKDLGIVKSTNYKSISYVAKELLVKINGEIALNRYGGWTRRVAHQATVDLEIANFEREVNDAVNRAVNQEDPILNQLMELVQAPVNHPLFT